MQHFAMMCSSDITHAYVYATEMVKHGKIEKNYAMFCNVRKMAYLLFTVWFKCSNVMKIDCGLPDA